MRKLVSIALLSSVTLCTQAFAWQELNTYTKKTYGENSELYKRTAIVLNQFEKESTQRLDELIKPALQKKPDMTVRFSNINCAVSDKGDDFMPNCTFVFTRYQPQYDENGIVSGVDSRHIFCPIPMSIDFKLAVNGMYDYIYVPSTQAGKNPNFLEYPPAGDPGKKAFAYLQECLTSTLVTAKSDEK